jgi:hypothetical protein
MDDNTKSDAGAIVDKLIDAVQRNDVAAISLIYADDIAIWHSFSNISVGKEAGISGLKSLANFEAFSYEVIERFVAGSRVFQRHILKIITREGVSADIPVAAFITVADGKIVRIYEYMDPSPLSR